MFSNIVAHFDYFYFVASDNQMQLVQCGYVVQRAFFDQ